MYLWNDGAKYYSKRKDKIFYGSNTPQNFITINSEGVGSGHNVCRAVE